MAPVLVLAEHNVDAIVVDGIGGRPLMGFNQVGIAVHAGVGADVQTTVHAFIAGRPAGGRLRQRLPALSRPGGTTALRATWSRSRCSTNAGTAK